MLRGQYHHLHFTADQEEVQKAELFVYGPYYTSNMWQIWDADSGCLDSLASDRMLFGSAVQQG